MSTWSPDEDKMLTALRQQDVTYAQIVVDLARAGFPTRTRNAAIGRAQRLGLKEPRTARQYQPRVAKVKAAKPPQFRAGRVAIAAPAHALAAPPIVVEPEPPAPAFDRPGVGLLDLDVKMDMCRFPVSMSGGKHLFCGDIVRLGRPYCRYHCRIAYQPPRERHGRSA